MCIRDSVEGVEKFLLRGFFSPDKLNIIHQKHIRRAVFVVKLRGGVVMDGADNFVCKFFTVHIDDIEIGVVFLHLAFDGVQKVRFAQAGAAPDEQRVICPGGVCCHGLCGCVRKFVGRTHNKVFKGEGLSLIHI